MTLKLTVVVDNCVPMGGHEALLGEHGLSILIETAGRRLLLDTGKSATLLHNLGLLGVNGKDLEMVVISHGHNDHTGGLYPLLEQARKPLPVFVHEHAFRKRFSTSSGKETFAGIPYRKEQLASLGADWRLVREPTEILPDLWVSGPILRTTVFETGDMNLTVRDEQNGEEFHDDLIDDMSLFYKSDKGLVVISGCAHSGLINTVKYGLAVTRCEHLHGWVGGTHLAPTGLDQQEETLKRLWDYQPQFVAANHCTGFKMMAGLYQIFGKNFIPAFVGTQIMC